MIRNEPSEQSFSGAVVDVVVPEDNCVEGTILLNDQSNSGSLVMAVSRVVFSSLCGILFRDETLEEDSMAWSMTSDATATCDGESKVVVTEDFIELPSKSVKFMLSGEGAVVVDDDVVVVVVVVVLTGGGVLLARLAVPSGTTSDLITWTTEDKLAAAWGGVVGLMVVVVVVGGLVVGGAMIVKTDEDTGSGFSVEILALVSAEFEICDGGVDEDMSSTWGDSWPLSVVVGLVVEVCCAVNVELFMDSVVICIKIGIGEADGVEWVSVETAMLADGSVELGSAEDVNWRVLVILNTWLGDTDVNVEILKGDSENVGWTSLFVSEIEDFSEILSILVFSDVVDGEIVEGVVACEVVGMVEVVWLFGIGIDDSTGCDTSGLVELSTCFVVVEWVGIGLGKAVVEEVVVFSMTVGLVSDELCWDGDE